MSSRVWQKVQNIGGNLKGYVSGLGSDILNNYTDYAGGLNNPLAMFQPKQTSTTSYIKPAPQYTPLYNSSGGLNIQTQSNVPTTDLSQYFGSSGDTGGVDLNAFNAALSAFGSSQQVGAEQDLAAQERLANQLYKERKGSLEQQRKELEAQLPITEQEITQSYQSALPEIERAQSERVGTLGAQREDVTRSERSGIADQRRLFNELITGGQRFAGTSVGGAFGELLGRQTAGAVGNIQTQARQGIAQIDDEIGRVNEFYNQTKIDLQNEMQTALRSARNTFQQEISKIRDAINIAEDDKNNMRADALGKFQTAVAGIREAQALKNLELQQWAASRSQSLNSAKGFLISDMSQLGAGIQGVSYMAQQDAKALTNFGEQMAVRLFESGKYTPTQVYDLVSQQEGTMLPLELSQQEGTLGYQQNPLSADAGALSGGSF